MKLILNLLIGLVLIQFSQASACFFELEFEEATLVAGDKSNV